MNADRAIQARRSIRLRDCDYSYPGMYFVTICTADRRCVFGKIEGGKVVLSPLGEVVEEEWLRTPSLRPYVELDEHVTMPNHFHGVLIIRQKGSDVAPAGTARRAPTEEFGRPVARSLPTIVGAFKAAVTCAPVHLGIKRRHAVWQRGYFEHIIRDEESLGRIREYIVNNPMRWEFDKENPDRTAEDEFDRWLSRFRSRPKVRKIDDPTD